jgi:hypothetical protein
VLYSAAAYIATGIHSKTTELPNLGQEGLPLLKLALLLTSRRNHDDHIELGSVLEMSRWSVDLEIVPSAYEEVKRWVRSLLTSQFKDLDPQPH